jgi:hypothetical protein
VSMERLQEVDHVVTAFRRYIDTDDKTLVDKIPTNELEKTLNIYGSSTGDAKQAWHKAIERELSRREKSRDHWVGFVKGVVVGLIVAFLWFIISKLIGG